MSVTSDILATYKGPRDTFVRLLSKGFGENMLLAFVMGFCSLTFVSQVPVRVREAHLTGMDLNGLLAGSLMGLIVLMPLLLYMMSYVLHIIAYLVRGKGTAYQSRLVLFWSLFAATPLMLIHGLIAGFFGSGPEKTIIGALWFVVVLWFWSAGMWQCYWARK